MSNVDIQEVLKLDKVTGSIKKIDLFLAGCPKKSLEYFQAYSYRNLILHKIGKTNDALKNLYTLVPEFPKLSDDIVVAICDAIIEITMEVGRFDQTHEYMSIKKQHLKVSNSVLGLRDDIRISLATKNYSDSIRLLREYLNDEIDTEEQLWANETLARLYYELHNYDAYLALIPELEKIYQEELNTNSLIQLAYSRLLISDQLGNYIQVIFDGNQLLNEYDLDASMRIKIVTLLIKSYIRSKDYRKASILESNYEELLSGVSDEIAINFAKVCLELYTQTNSMVSVKHYEDLIETYKTGKKKNRNKKNSIEVVIPSIEEKEEEENDSFVESQIIKKTFEPKTVLVSTRYQELQKILKILNNLDSQVKFREIYRLVMIELERIIGFEEAYLLYFFQGYQGLDYHKERAYDKKLDYDDLEDTLNFLAIAKKEEMFLNEETTEGLKNILTNQPFENQVYGYAIPLQKERECYASLAFFSGKPFIDEELAYDTICLISEMLNKCLIETIEQSVLKANNKKMFFIYENMTSGVKELLNDHIHLSKQATVILDAFEDMTLEEYKLHIHPADLALYNQVLAELYQYMPNSKETEYRYQSNGHTTHIKETFFPSYENGNILLYSLIEDVTKNVQIQSDLTNLAYTNPTTKLPTEVKLLVDMRECISLKKMALAVIDVFDFKLYEELYGMAFANQLILAIANEFKTAFKDDYQVTLYHLGFDRYAILFQNTNDRRTVENLLGKSFQQVSTNLNLINSRIHLHFNAGVYRVSKSQNNITAEKVLEYAYDALGDAKTITSSEDHISHYDTEISKQRFNENQLITHISESIDHGRIGLSYKQIVRVEDQSVFAYYANVALDNYDIDPFYMQKVIRRRELEELMDKYTISHASREMKQLKESTKAALYVFIEVSQKTLTDSFVSFMETQNQVYKTTKRNIVLVVEDASNILVKTLRKNGYLIAGYDLMDVYLQNIDFYLYDLLKNGMDHVTEIMDLCKTKEITFILSHVDSKEDVTKAIQLGVNYFYGSFYKKSVRMKKVIEKLS